MCLVVAGQVNFRLNAAIAGVFEKNFNRPEDSLLESWVVPHVRGISEA